MDTKRSSWLNVKLQQLEAKLKVLSDVDKDILDKCEVGGIEHEINKSEMLTTKIMDCQQRIHEAIKKPTNSPVVPFWFIGSNYDLLII